MHPINFQVGLNNAVTEEGRSRSGLSWFLSADFESVRHLQAARMPCGKAACEIPKRQQSASRSSISLQDQPFDINGSS